MNTARKRVEVILQEWKGEDAAGQSSPADVAERIDHAYQEYLASLPQKTASIKAGQEANERRVA